MKALLLLAALLFAGCTTAPDADPSDPWPAPAGPAEPGRREPQVLLDETFQVDPAHPVSFDLQVPDPGRLQLVYEFEPAAYRELDINGPGWCDVHEDNAGFVFTSHYKSKKDCEAPPGAHQVSVTSTGVISGRLTITG